MKKILQFKMMRSLLLIVIAVMGFSSSGWADPSNYGGLLYNLSSASPYTAELVGVKDVPQEANFSQQSTSITVPATLDAGSGIVYNVTSIAANAFKGCTAVTDIYLPTSITKIDKTAFTECTNLKALFSPATSVPDFTDGVLPEGTSVYVENNTIATNYHNGTWAADITILSKSFDQDDFTYDVTSHNTVAINGIASGKTGELTHHILSSVVYNQNTFDISSLLKLNDSTTKSIVIPASIKKIGVDAFASSTSLKYIKFMGVSELAGSITTGTIEEIVIDNNAVNNTLTTLPAGFTKTNLCLSTTGKISVYSTGSNLGKALLATAGGFAEEDLLTALNGYDVTSINGTDFWTLYKGLTDGYEVLFPAVKVGDLSDGFTFPTNLNIQAIGPSCFSGYKNIKSITLNSGLKTIGMNAFATGVKLSTMTIPASVTRIDAPIFDASLPDKLIVEGTIAEGAVTAPLLYVSNTEDKTAAISSPVPSTSKKLEVPYTSIDAFKAYNGNATLAWGQYAESNTNSQTFADGDFIYSYVSTSPKALALVDVATTALNKQVFTIPAKANVEGASINVTTIGKNAFAACANYKSMIIPEGITTIEEGAFSGVSSGNLYVQFPSTLTSYTKPFADAAMVHTYFLGSAPTTFVKGNSTYGVITVKDQDAVTAFKADVVFGSDANVSSVTTPGTVYYGAPYWYEFISKTNPAATVAGIVLPNDPTQSSYTIPSTILTSYNVTNIQAGAFADCASMKSIEIPATITFLGSGSLNNEALTKVVLKHTTAIPSLQSGTTPFDIDPAGQVKLYVEKGTKTSLYLKDDNTKWAGILAENIIGDGENGSIFSDGTFWYTVKKYDAANWDYEVVLDSLVSKTATAYTIPDSVKYATADTYKYKVTEIGAEAFKGISNALTIVIPASVKAIDADAFFTKDYPKYVVLPKTPATDMKIAENAFYSTVLFYTEATKPVADSGWDKIKDYEITIPTGTLEAYTGFTKAKVLGDENSIYMQDGIWYQVYSATNTKAAAINPVDIGTKTLSIAGTIINGNFTVDKVGEAAFKYTYVSKITLPSTMKILADGAFYKSMLTTITLPASVDSIGWSALDVPPLTDVTVLNDTPCKWHAGDNYLPGNGVKLHVSSTTVKNAYLDKGWEGYKIANSSLIIPTNEESTVADLVKGNDVTIIDATTFHIGTSNVDYGYTSNIFAGYSPKSITIKDALTTLTLSKDTVSEVVTVSNDKSDKAGLTLTISNSKLGGITNNDTVTIIADSKSSLGTITNNGVLVEENGYISEIPNGKTQLKVSGDIDGKSVHANGSTKIYASATVLKGSAKADSVQFVWQLKDAKNVYQTISKGTHFAIAKSSALRAAAKVTLIDSLTITEGGDYRCLITDFDSTKTASATLGVYGTVTTTTSKTLGTITLKKFKKGYYFGVPYGKDTTFVFTKDTAFEFQIMDTLNTLITNYAVVTATYKSTGEKDTLNADGRFYYRILHTDDTITVSVDSCIITANEPISLTNNVKVWGNDGILHVSTPQRVTVYIATFDGRMRAVKSEAGDQEFYLGKGIYIIRIEDRTWKIKI